MSAGHCVPLFGLVLACAAVIGCAGTEYVALRERGDNFYHWMTTMYDVGEVDYDPTQSGLDETTYQAPSAGAPVS